MINTYLAVAFGYYISMLFFIKSIEMTPTHIILLILLTIAETTDIIRICRGRYK